MREDIVQIFYSKFIVEKVLKKKPKKRSRTDSVNGYVFIVTI
jgi:hypothetical protein